MALEMALDGGAIKLDSAVATGYLMKLTFETALTVDWTLHLFLKHAFAIVLAHPQWPTLAKSKVPGF
jgi:hypothetical protein